MLVDREIYSVQTFLNHPSSFSLLSLRSGDIAIKRETGDETLQLHFLSNLSAQFPATVMNPGATIHLNFNVSL